MSLKLKRQWMQTAIDSARDGIERLEGGPFGAVIVRNGKVIATAHNTVLKDQDATCHAEINAIRAASRKRKSFDLSGCEIYSTNEPCPMCFSAIHWARIAKLFFGTTIADVRERGFHELSVASGKMKSMGKSGVVITAGFMKKECLELLKIWDKKEGKKIY